jgi:hypothetical protein
MPPVSSGVDTPYYILDLIHPGFARSTGDDTSPLGTCLIVGHGYTLICSDPEALAAAVARLTYPAAITISSTSLERPVEPIFRLHEGF